MRIKREDNAAGRTKTKKSIKNARKKTKKLKLPSTILENNNRIKSSQNRVNKKTFFPWISLIVHALSSCDLRSSCGLRLPYNYY